MSTMKPSKYLKKTCRHNGERYENGLPWKTDVNLPNNYYAALNRLRSLEKRSTRNPELKKNSMKLLPQMFRNSTLRPL